MKYHEKLRFLNKLFSLNFIIYLYGVWYFYKRICSCESKYVSKTERNVEVKYLEHNHPSGNSKTSEHFYQNINHVLTWSLICSVPKIDRTRKNLKTFYIALMRPNLNEQCDYNILALFRNGIIYFNYSTVIINWSVFCFLSCFMIDFC